MDAEDLQMPVTQRWVHGGLILAVVVFSMCLTVLVLGAARTQPSDTGLPGSRAAGFSLRDIAGQSVFFDTRSTTNPICVVIIADHVSKDVNTHNAVINGLASAYRDDPDVRIVGVAAVRDATLLGPGATEPSSLEIRCPQLHVARDIDGSVARAYRVSGIATLFVIDREGVIRARLPITQDGTGIAAIELINGLRKQAVQTRTLMSDATRRH